jgi:hypothetical protein
LANWQIWLFITVRKFAKKQAHNFLGLFLGLKILDKFRQIIDAWLANP